MEKPIGRLAPIIGSFFKDTKDGVTVEVRAVVPDSFVVTSGERVYELPVFLRDCVPSKASLHVFP